MPSILNATTTNGLVTSADNSGSLQLQTNNGTTAVTIDTSQRVGVGTTTPASSLHVAGSSAQLTVSNADASVYTYMLRDGFYSVGGRMDIYTGGANAQTFWTNASERMRITSGGDVLVNSTTAGLSGAGCQIIKYANGNYIDVGHTTGDTGSEGYIRFIRNGTTVGQVQSNGTTQVSYSTSSDYRLKENVAPMTGALAKVQQLKPVTYNWKADGSAGQGFIAHELQEVVPDCVTGEKDAVNEDGSIKPQGIDTSFLVATLTAALQEAHGLIKDLQARVETLEAK